MDTNHNYMIDDYLTGRLNQRETADFEKQMQADQELRAEVDFQREVIEGIRTYRKTELKSKLAAIPAPETVGFLGNSAGKIIAGVAASVAVVGGLYWYAQDVDSSIAPAVSEGRVIDVTSPKAYKAPQLMLDIDEIEESDKNTGSSRVAEEVRKNLAVVEDRPAQIEEGAEEQMSELEEDPFTPSIVLPEDVSDISSDEAFESEPISKEVFEKPSTSPEEQVDIEVEKGDVEEFAYKYFDSKLTLIGDFDKSPYQILELIGPSGKDIFLYYDSAYYEINLTSDPKMLTPIEDESKRKELEILKNYK